MFRIDKTETRSRRSSPHTRGDVPSDYPPYCVPGGFSPHAWGCSFLVLISCLPSGVLPTRVGMFQMTPDEARGFTRSPHTRGDVPPTFRPGSSPNGFSPHAWGCSAGGRVAERRGGVLPTRVGMFRTECHWGEKRRSSPHARGDVPTRPPDREKPRTFSPRPWGCSGAAKGSELQPHVLPTPVGMFRDC